MTRSAPAPDETALWVCRRRRPCSWQRFHASPASDLDPDRRHRFDADDSSTRLSHAHSCPRLRRPVAPLADPQRSRAVLVRLFALYSLRLTNRMVRNYSQWSTTNPNSIRRLERQRDQPFILQSLSLPPTALRVPYRLAKTVPKQPESALLCLTARRKVRLQIDNCDAQHRHKNARGCPHAALLECRAASSRRCAEPRSAPLAESVDRTAYAAIAPLDDNTLAAHRLGQRPAAP